MENHGSEPLPSKVDRKRWNNLQIQDDSSSDSDDLYPNRKNPIEQQVPSHYPDQFLVDSLQAISSIIVDISMVPGTMTPCYPHSSTGHLAMGESSTGYLIVGYAMAHLVR